MSGYTPLFSSLTTGTLCGRWPDIGLWPIVLSMSDKHGVVDVTPAYISGVTGLPLADVIACMKRFCEPDPYSRSPADAGARLALIDSHRDWGWKVINHGVYREKARKQMQQIEYTQSGRDAERKRIERERASSDVQSRPAVSGPVRPSDSDSDSDSNKEKKQDRRTTRAVESPPAGFAELQSQYPKRAGGQRWGDALKFFKRRIAEGEQPQVILAGVKRYAEFTRAVGIERTEKVQQAATFLGDNRGYLEQWQAPARAKSAVEQAREDLRKNINVSTVVSEQGPGPGNSDLGSFARLLR